MEVVGAPGFEPGASCAQGRRATRLRYAPTSEKSILQYFKFLHPVNLLAGAHRLNTCPDSIDTPSEVPLFEAVFRVPLLVALP